MKQVFNDLKLFVKQDFKWDLYAYFFLFLAVTITINYSIDFEDRVLDSYVRTIWSFVYYTLFYAVAYYGIAIPQLFWVKKQEILKTKEYWIKTVFFILIAGFSAYFYWDKTIVIPDVTRAEQYFSKKIFIELSSFFEIALPLFLFWLIYDRCKYGFYGFSSNKSPLKPYFIMLAFMLPLIAWASFQTDFQDTYPVFKPWNNALAFDLSPIQQSLIFELFYGVSFVCVELLFRGAFVIGLVHLLGKEVILPMVSMYAFLHFGKPLGETLGSIFGAYILGVLALNKKHILGGVIIHMGVALLMETAALYQYYFN